ncbi:MAG: tetratricopeptide repeat protein [Acidobacteriota bacterium]|nr:tetratricopeptide repeat protein [Acidobacteriota bacterium]
MSEAKNLLLYNAKPYRSCSWVAPFALLAVWLAPAALARAHAASAGALRRQRAEAAASAGKCGEAQNILPNSPAIAGVCYFRIKDFSRAIPLLERAAHLAPGNENVRIFLARAYSGAGRADDAISTLKSWMRDHGEDADALYWTGNFYQELAGGTFQAMVAKHPDSYQAYEAEGGQFVYRQQYPQALKAYQKAASLAPAGTPGLHFHLGDVYFRTLRYEDAKNELLQELRLNPNHAQANYELGAIYAKERDPAQAIPYLQKAISFDPSLIEARRALGSAYLEQKNYPAALAELLQVEKSKPADHTIHAMLASTYRQMGHLADAKREAEISERLERETIETIQANKAAEKKLGPHM